MRTSTAVLNRRQAIASLSSCRSACLSLLLAFGCFPGCATLDGSPYDVFDPYESPNRFSYRVSDWLDRKALAPIARGYVKVTPAWLEAGILNFFTNLRTIDSSVNGFLQGKPKAGATDFARLLINSTLGLGGFFDVAQTLGLRFQDEDLGQTLAVAGLTRTRYIYVPLLGPSSARDLPGVVIRAYLPSWILGSVYSWWLIGLDVVSFRADALTLTDARDATALDAYVFTREAYYQRRRFQVYDGNPPMDDFFDDEFDDEVVEEIDAETDEDNDQENAEELDAPVGAGTPAESADPTGATAAAVIADSAQ